ncbi:biotin carboxylase N-terminal domain-containing protein [Roseococcus sp. SDR]|uniref:ATP-binding protein n=1 Tax=Roseococcus sp. SDR TaxID=2835532 RepID=UPI0027385EFD|nr:biotin carboxylase N-terminal domain-containing protein [Roseococcus sp. SDR]
MFSKILIANRGEIAVRIIRTARRMGIATVAVFSEADANALHVREADEAYAIGPAPAAQSYLRGEVILEVARRSGAQAVHPGYGFLSENADFAEGCAAAGIAFIGPPASAIRAMGSKAESKRLMVAAGVPTVPGYHGEAQEEALLAAEAARIGFPVLIKASAGGGGKGMRPVYAAEDFAAELAGARREALAAFGDGRVLIEKYLQRPRHVEVQVFGDSHGRVTHLHTRDCSVQRRHQKVLEEAPAPDLSDALRATLHEAAENAARAVGYTNAGTVEFVVEGEHAYFLEMNTRLQVEHPVTEMVTGLDLVEWQLRVAAGEALPAHWPPPAQGHAMEVRIYAEEPERDFRPATGRLRKFAMLDEGARFDTGFTPGDVVTAAYDPMLAKVIVAGTDRGAALTRLAAALDALEIEGLGNNARFLSRLARHPALRAGELDTGFIARHAEALLTPRGPAPERVLIAASAGLAELGRRAVMASPWLGRAGWRLQGSAETVEAWEDGTGPRRITLQWRPEGHAVAVDDGTTQTVRVSGAGERLMLLQGDAAEAFILTAEPDGCTLRMAGETWRLHRRDPLAPASEDVAGESRLSAPIPGRVVKLLVAVGEAVTKGQLLAVLEAMKTEIKITAPRDGVVAHLGCAEGENIEEGVEILNLATEETVKTP